MRALRSHFLSLVVLVAATLRAEAAPDCKCVPDDPCWPSDDEFSALNETVSGKLIRGVPPGAVCYPERPEFNETACDYVLTHWLNSTFHAQHPISVGFPQWAENPCPPIYPNGTSVNGDPNAGKVGCTLGAYPVYALNATNPEHVQKVVNFAARRKIRLNVKSTGHSFTGRSTAFGSISIWTHYLQGIEYHKKFQPQSCPSATRHDALRIAAGSRVRDVYESANANDVIAVGGSAQDVGIVGWLTGGGHGPLTSTYGMGADNVMQATVVTPRGDLLTVNECHHPDLLWAIRGGGGGTFGAVTEVVMKAFPSPTQEEQFFSIEATDPDDVASFWNATAFFLSEQPRLKAGGMSGYMFIFGPSQFGPVELGGSGASGPAYSFTGSLSVFRQPNGTAERLFEPIKQHMASFGDSINYTTVTSYSPSFFSSWDTSIGYEPVGGGGAVLCSRLLTENSLLDDMEHLGQVVKNLTMATGSLQVYSVANSENKGLDVAMNPAWRDAVLHAITGWGFLDTATQEEQQAAYDYVTYTLAPQLKSLAPDSGAYFNEGDPFDPNWQYTFFGENYPRLQSVKRHYDPDSVMWCYSCAGSEEWAEQDDGRLCRTSWAAESQEVMSD